MDGIANWIVFGKNTVVSVNNKYLTINHIENVPSDEVIEKYGKDNNSKVPVVKPFVANWYEEHRCDLEYSIWEYIRNWDVQDSESDFYDFMDYNDNHAIETLVKMKDGYEVEKEQLYYVQLIEGKAGYLNVRNDGIHFFNDASQNCIVKTKFTEAEIKKMDERFWQFAVPVKEVDGEV
ncbi:DUF1642 domain-containing protein [Listeria monocytogenes]|nr:DUF1642 domain-containing protein [Listeria monocytogenes]